jgi:cell division protein FtsI/penicillin-binding protein 2
MAGRDGAALVLDIPTGEILAAYRMDVAARRVASPGSAIKPFTLLALAEAGLVDRETSVFCPHDVRIGDRILDCSHPRLEVPLDPVSALAYSCNHFFSQLAGQLPFDALYRAFGSRGFNALSGRWPTEVAGVVELPESNEALTLMSLGEESIGVTPLALAEAYRRLALTVAEDGGSGGIVLEGLRAGVEFGTGKLAGTEGVDVAGKTGTSAGHAWFAGFAPAERPEVVVVVFLESGTGGADAAPVAGTVFRAWADGRGIGR